MSKLIITEKPSVAMEFAKALKISGAKRQNGYIEDKGYIITWCVGHLITMSYPDKYDESLKKWNIEDLPFIPKKYKYEVIDSVRDQYEVVKKLLNRDDVDTIYYAGDSAREGEYIQRLVRQHAGRNESATEKRVWIDSQTEEEILNGIQNAKSLESYNALSESAYARAIEDYLIGINFSRALTIMYGAKVFSCVNMRPGTIAVGRVMSCVLALIVEREREIRNNIRVKYYPIIAEISGINAKWKAYKGSDYYDYEADLYVNGNTCGFLSEEKAQQFAHRLDSRILAKKKKEQDVNKGAPLLFNLAELQGTCSRLYKIGPDETLNIAQTLYEKKLVTYPRTDARVLTTAVSKVIDTNIKGLRDIGAMAEYVDTILDSGSYKNLAATKYVDDVKVSDHYAIIPTGKTDEIDSLSDIEKKVFLLIIRRFLSIFYPPAKYHKISISFEANGEEFNASASTLVDPGYLVIAGKMAENTDDDDNDEDNDLIKLLAKIQEGQTYDAMYKKVEAETKPPARYTSGSIILTMENAGKFIKEEALREQIKGSGIGTSATRAETIKKLEKISYISINKKTQVITPTVLGEIVYEALNLVAPNMLSPKLTASWETGLDAIAKGYEDRDGYLETLYTYVRETTELIKRNMNSELSKKIHELKSVYKDINESGEIKEAEPVICPKCGSKMYKSNKHGGYYCSAYKNDPPCQFSVYGEIAGKKLSDSILRKLINGEQTDRIDGFKSKAGKKFSCMLKLDDTGKIQFIFDDKKEKKD